MKKIALVLLLCLAVLPITAVQAQNVESEGIGIMLDYDRGSIVARTRYTLNGQAIQVGETRYDKDSGVNEEGKAEEIVIGEKIDLAVEQHRQNLIKRIAANRAFINEEKLKRQTELSQAVLDKLPDMISKEEIIEGVKYKVVIDELKIENKKGKIQGRRRYSVEDVFVYSQEINFDERIEEEGDAVDALVANVITQGQRLKKNLDMIELLKPTYLGKKGENTEAIETFKGIDIKVTYDQKNTVTDTIIAIPE